MTHHSRADSRNVVDEMSSVRSPREAKAEHMQRQNPSAPAIAAWWCLVAAGIAACGVALGDFPFTTSSALLLLTIIFVPAAIMQVLWRTPEAATAHLAYSSDRAPKRRSHA
jgi:hypothetical protein